MADQPEQPGLIKLDFARYYPHKFWISDWGKDETYTDGFRYKVLSVRDENEDTVEIVLLLQSRDGTKEEMHRATVNVAAVDRYTRVFVEGLQSEYGIDFEEQDFSRVRSAEEFEQSVAAYGWQSEDAQA